MDELKKGIENLYLTSIIYDESKYKEMKKQNKFDENFFEILYRYIINNKTFGTINKTIGNRLLEIVNIYRWGIYKKDIKNINKCNIMINLINDSVDLPNEFQIYLEIQNRGIKTIEQKTLSEKYTEDEKSEIYTTISKDYEIITELIKDQQLYQKSQCYQNLMKSTISISYFLRTIVYLKNTQNEILENINVKRNIKHTLEQIQTYLEEIKRENLNKLKQRTTEILNEKNPKTTENILNSIANHLEEKEKKLKEIEKHEKYIEIIYYEIIVNYNSIIQKHNENNSSKNHKKLLKILRKYN